jgi:hypothetical protein
MPHSSPALQIEPHVARARNEHTGYISAFNPYATSIYCRL